MTAVALAAIGLAAAIVAAAVWAIAKVTEVQERLLDSEVEKTEREADLRTTEAALDTSERLRKAEAARADALEQELAHADQATLVAPDPGARGRVLARWRDSLRATPPDSGDGAGPMSHPAAADGDPGDADEN